MFPSRCKQAKKSPAGALANGTLAGAIGVIQETCQTQSRYTELAIHYWQGLFVIAFVQLFVVRQQLPYLLCELVRLNHPIRRLAAVDASLPCLRALQPAVLNP